MKILFNMFVTVLFAWPAMLIGYCFEAAKTGFIAGAFICGQHSDMALSKFTNWKDTQ